MDELTEAERQALPRPRAPSRGRFGDSPEAWRAAIEATENEDTLLRWVVVLFATSSAEDTAAAVLGTDVSDTATTAR